MQSNKTNIDFVNFCCQGQLLKAQELLQKNPTIDISADNNRALRSACKNEHLEVVQWLLQVKPIDTITNDTMNDKNISITMDKNTLKSLKFVLICCCLCLFVLLIILITLLHILITL